MNVNSIKQKSRIVYSILMSGVMGAAACNTAASYHKNHAHAGAKDGDIARGEALAVKYCQSCHMLPSPGLLDAGTWEKGVLPAMGPRLGIFEYMHQRYPENSQDPNVGRGFYPSQPMMTPEEWRDLITYYTALAPDSLMAPSRKEALRPDTTSFRVILPRASAGVASSPPATCFIQYDSILRQVMTSDILTHTFSRWDNQLRVLPGATVAGAVVSMVQSQGGRLACNIGAFQPNNAKAGSVDRWVPGPSSAVPDLTTVVRDLVRPVHIAEADLNGDGREDIVVCEFGYIKGSLSWLENKGDGSYEKHVLRDMPGAIRVVIEDHDHDGRPDIWALFAQGEEGIFLYTNKGGGQFAEQEVLRFPPSYGSTYFELTDLNGDGRKDILYTCGDNGDFSTVLKPYHGIYIFLNDGAVHFTQQYFFPMNGCYRAMPVDIDRDGMLDIAAIAYFADFDHHPEEGFIYLHNNGGLHFDARTVPGTEAGRWITMDVRDIDGDGRPDVLLANCSVGPLFNKGTVDWKKGPPFMLLKNNVR
ncbi:MAG: VCBS repeat-containing protein [Chitinophagaceae bacterium]|nr:VCBS repeat-containing protein [Chitinophagaceae bacterium]